MMLRKTSWTMMTIVTVCLPLAVNHAAAEENMDACITTFVQTRLPEHARISVRKVSTAPTLLTDMSRRSEVQLEARERRSGRMLAAAKCVTDGNGRVLALLAPNERSSRLAGEQRDGKRRSRL